MTLQLKLRKLSKFWYLVCVYLGRSRLLLRQMLYVVRDIKSDWIQTFKSSSAEVPPFKLFFRPACSDGGREFHDEWSHYNTDCAGITLVFSKYTSLSFYPYCDQKGNRIEIKLVLFMFMGEQVISQCLCRNKTKFLSFGERKWCRPACLLLDRWNVLFYSFKSLLIWLLKNSYIVRSW